MVKLKKFKFEDYYKFTIERVAKWKSDGNYFYMRSLSSAADARTTMGGKEYIMFGSNNYLGLAAHPKVIEAAVAAAKRFGVGTGGARVSSGNMDLHVQLEAELAKLKKTEAALVFNCGYLANVGTISAIADEETVIFNDSKNHASIIDGGQFSRSINEFYDHNNMNVLEELLIKHQEASRKLIAVDGVFSMDGDIAKLPELVKLADKYNAELLVDDAHSTGILGENGEGTAEYFGLTGKIKYEIGTLSKAIGGAGGFLATSKEMIVYLQHASKQFIFSTALPPPSAAAALAALEIIKNEPERRKELVKKGRYMREGLKRIGYDVGLSETQIIPVIIGEEYKTFKLVSLLENDGIFVLPAAYPVVRKKESRVRMSIIATHRMDDLDKTLDLFKKHGKHLEIV